MSATKVFDNINKIKAELAFATGTEHYYRGMNRKCLCTDGVQHYKDIAGAHWLWDIIETEVYQAFPKTSHNLMFIHFIVKDGKADIKLVRDTNETPIFKKHIKWTDHVDGDMLFYASWDGDRLIVYLPSEH